MSDERYAEKKIKTDLRICLVASIIFGGLTYTLIGSIFGPIYGLVSGLGVTFVLGCISVIGTYIDTHFKFSKN